MSTIFPRWTNGLPTVLAGGAVSTLGLVIGVVWYYFTPAYWEVGYMPTQPGSGFSHQIHAGKLGMDCRYCHSHIEESSEANIPAVATCYGCHADGRLRDSKVHKVQFIREAYAKDEPIFWRRVHKLPDYVRNFPHSAHLNAGVSCYSCHGNIARLPVVWQHESLSMSWCLDCHRNAEQNLVPKDKVFRIFDAEQMFTPEGEAKRVEQSKKFFEERRIAAPEACGACHY